jgi:glycosyltransferase involved in cell wall biosynthesis
VTKKDRSAIFTGVARDCAAHLPGVLENLGRFAASYRAASFLFVVSDSKDDTRTILERWLADGRSGRVIDLGALEGRLTKRTERIAFARNAGLDSIDAGHDHLVVTDLDDVLAQPVDAGAFARAAAWLDGDPARAGVMANAMPRYYDVWALRHERWCPDDCWHPIWGRPPDETFEAAKFREVFTRQIEIPPSLPPIAVRSAFGGLGIYRLPAALAARYDGVDAEGRETSEHVAFNTAIGRAGGQLHIFPALQVHAPRQHLYQPSEFKWRWRMTMMARRTAEIAQPPWRRMLAPT